ncbi:putative regulator of nonsense transcripts 1, putative,nonsense mRNA reducing factor 1 [Trypanosoma theileri]|uniref:Putative regulator of nonsense transcripts 1, putative,nonsense mRNA reducing factor 1 n=1 Tax=Trypanosoma theileri TaxID=67003 RepID=A0A1X0NST8_9TRYP|nr:putative regulator of nonsense transcripts 1, putative,nonsense mRNA reducing factor 1 [Trypanosoma theileri]ORC87767.1 putative regulator of nonsense transcripts 1, putative,nonsense mRNA reducing factor 1 [Trypanosoma theileri]
MDSCASSKDFTLDGQHSCTEETNDDADDTVKNDSMDIKESCAYCGENDPSSLAMCTTCSRWFCNSAHGTSGSHVIMHLAKSKHQSLQLHSKNMLGDDTLKCYVCHSANVFSLGFMPSKEESVVVLVCREPCLHSRALREQNLDSSSWLPLIDERRLLPWICKVRGTGAKKLTLHDITAIELEWGNKLINSEEATEIAPTIPNTFNNGNEYLEIFTTLIRMDADASQRKKEYTFENVPCLLQKQLGTRCFFYLKQLPVADAVFRRGEYASITVKGSNNCLFGTIVDICKSQNGDEDVILETEIKKTFDKAALEEILSVSVVTFRFELNIIAALRKTEALHKFVASRHPLSEYLYYTILGQAEKAEKYFKKVPYTLTTQLISKLNRSQEIAVRNALENPLTLIQGPPGTGKTTTGVTIVKHLHHIVKERILVCAPSNIAVDHLAERLSTVGLKVTRLQPRYRVPESDIIKNLSLDQQVEDFIDSDAGDNRVKSILNSMRNQLSLNNDEYDLYKKNVRDLEKLILGSADVVCCTCVGAGDPRLKGIHFKYVLIDEVTQGTEPETIIPLVCGAEQVIFIGDHCQLRPVVSSLAAEKAGLHRSLFERLLYVGHRAFRLDVQYRMHPSLSNFPSSYFYEGTLQNGVTEMERNASRVFPWPEPSKPLFFYNTTAPEELGANGCSYLNRAEAALVEKIVTKLIRDGKVNPEEIGVITPYYSQSRYIRNYLSRCGNIDASVYDRVEIATVDSFQGREKEYIILSCVRSNHHQGIGFVVDERRLNVSITRAKYGLFIIGNARLLSRYPAWHALLRELLNLSLVVDGSIDALVPSAVVLGNPEKNS